MARTNRDIMPPTLDNGAPAPAYTAGGDPTGKLRDSARNVKSTPPAPTDQSSAQLDPRRSFAEKISKIGKDGHGPGVSL